MCVCVCVCVGKLTSLHHQNPVPFLQYILLQCLGPGSMYGLIVLGSLKKSLASLLTSSQVLAGAGLPMPHLTSVFLHPPGNTS